MTAANLPADLPSADHERFCDHRHAADDRLQRGFDRHPGYCRFLAGDQFAGAAVVPSGVTLSQLPLAVTSTNQYSAATVTYSNRPPFLAQSPVASNSFTMRFYYKNQANFDWPNRVNPGIGAIVPYLLPKNSADDPTSSAAASLDIVYRPVCPR